MTLLTVAFAAVALVYAMAGFGGGSAYLALFALCAVPSRSASVLALICNIVVVSNTTVSVIRQRKLEFMEVVLFGCFSVPSAWCGARLRLSDRALDLALAIALGIAAISLAHPRRAVEPGAVAVRSKYQRITLAAALAIPTSLVGGIVGIGGGVFLSPALHWLKWNTSQRIAALCSVFILVNSIAGLVGKRNLPDTLHRLHEWYPLPIAVLLGGAVGTMLLTRRLSNNWITRVTACIVFVAAIQTLRRFFTER